VVVSEPHRGYGTACLAGIDALPEEIEIVVFLDADYSDHPEEMEILITPILKNEADFVLGSRMMRATSRSALTPQQRFGNWWLQL
jgi:glycosyltransferase involved in cell wall biosynthesis